MSATPPLGRCGSCGAPVYWAVTEAGRPTPVDPEPAPDGTQILTLRYDRDAPPEIRTRYARLTEPLAEGEKRRRPHWATCPSAAQHRRGGR